jgi:hypothetical protein
MRWSKCLGTNFGGNPKVIEMLVGAGADPNPLLPGQGQRLSEQIQEIWAQNRGMSLSVPTIETFEKLAKVAIKH